MSAVGLVGSWVRTQALPDLWSPRVWFTFRNLKVFDFEEKVRKREMCVFFEKNGGGKKSGNLVF